MPATIRLSDQQYQLVQTLCALGEGSAKDLQEQLRHLGLAHTTIATVLSRLEKKGYLTSKISGRERIYRSLIDDTAVKRSMVSSLVDNLFKGDSKGLLTHLVNEGEIDLAELDELRKMLRSENK